MGGGLAGKAVVCAGLICVVLAWPAPADAPGGPATDLPFTPTVIPPPAQVNVSVPAATDASVVPLPRTATVSFSGDVLLHSVVWGTAATRAESTDEDGYDFRTMFAPVSPWIEDVDWSVCHMEVNLAADNSGLSSFPVFRGPGAIASDLSEIGFDACSTASNHSLDGRTPATFETIDVLEAAGLRHTGTARSARESEQNVHIEVNGIRIAHLAYTYWFNGFLLPADEPWAANEIDEERILADAEIARLEGADVVVVSLHWGDQYRHEPNRQQADLGPRLLASPHIDLLIGHHAHVVQRIDQIDGEWLVYGLGNFLSNQTQLRRRDELIVNATIEERPDGSFAIERLEVIPVFLDLDTFQIWPSGPSVRDPETPPGLNGALSASFDRVTAVLETGSGWSSLELVGS